MERTPRILFGCLAISLAIGQTAFAQFQKTRNAPTQADWTAMAKLPDFSGVWEQGGGGGGARGGARGAAGTAPAADGRGAAPAAGARGAAAGGRGGRGAGGAAEGPSLTPEYAAKSQALAQARQA